MLVFLVLVCVVSVEDVLGGGSASVMRRVCWRGSVSVDVPEYVDGAESGVLIDVVDVVVVAAMAEIESVAWLFLWLT